MKIISVKIKIGLAMKYICRNNPKMASNLETTLNIVLAQVKKTLHLKLLKMSIIKKKSALTIM